MKSMKMKTFILLILHAVLLESAKLNVRPAYEVNEQTKAEEKKSSNFPGSLPYGNPLAGNLLQNAKLHAQNQQAMFQAEKTRQHRVQLQRWAKQHQPTDSYIKAYHETQENQQLAMEQQQSMLNEKKLMMPTNKENKKRMKIPELTKITKEDAVTSPEVRRSYRSYGSNEYKNYFQPARHQNVYISSEPSYDQGITINPNGITYLNPKQPNKLYTEAVENKIQYAYPNQNQIHYEYVQDISSLNALLKKSPQDQLTGLNAMTHVDEANKPTVEAPVNLYVYLKQPETSENYKQTYIQIPENSVNTLADEPQVRDHTPINEYIDDIEDPNKSTTIKAFGLQSLLTTQQPDADTSTISYLNAVTQPIEYNFNIKTVEAQPQAYQTLKEEVQPVYLTEEIKNGGTEEIYLPENDLPKGVQHLQHDGQEISAYSEDNVSTLGSNRNRRSTLDSEAFTMNSNKSDNSNETLPTPEQLKRSPLIRKIPYYRPNYEEIDDYDTELPKKHYEVSYDYESDEQDDYDLSDYEYVSPNQKPNPFFAIPHRVRQENLDLKGSYSKYNLKRHTPINSPIHSTNLNDFSTSYGVPYEIYKPEYGVPKHSIFDSVSSLPYTHFDHPEPVYILTESQLKLLLNRPNINEFQWGKGKIHRPRKFKKRYRGNIPRYLKKNLLKLNKLTTL